MHTTPAIWANPGAAKMDVSGTRPVVLVEANSAITPTNNPGQDVFNRLALVSIGKEFQAQVVARQSDGSHLVRIADITARMALPEGRNPGDLISLKLVSATPRPTFLLGETLASSAGALASGDTTGVGKTQLETLLAARQGTLAGTTTAGVSTSLSATGKMIDTLLLAAQLAGSPARLAGSVPIATSANTSPTILAQAMHEAIVFSGLFYESHLAEWIVGKRPLQAVMREPQADSNHPHSKWQPENGRSLIDLMHTLEATQGKGSTEENTGNLLPTLNEETARMMRLQLDALEHRRLAWHGEIWPEQDIEWEVSEEEQRSETSDVEPIWRSDLRLTLPALGAIKASIRLSGGRVQMQLRTESSEIATTLQKHTKKLASTLDLANSPLDLLTVSHGKTE